MPGCGGCGRRAARQVEVKLPGKPVRTVSQAAATQLTRGVKGATVKPVKEGKS